MGQHDIMRVLEKKPLRFYTINELAKIINISENSVSKSINKLRLQTHHKRPIIIIRKGGYGRKKRIAIFSKKIKWL
jgi:predicted transcriptional regulator